MSTKTAYVWGPMSNFSAALLASLLESGWHLHVACKSALQISLSPLDMASSAQHSIETAVGSREKCKQYGERLKFIESDEPQRGTTYDIILFSGLPSNFDEPRVSRAPWAVDGLSAIRQKLKGVPTLIISSLWGGVQNDGVVPEEIEFDRRKPHSHFEGVCQHYEQRILKIIDDTDGKWHLVRLPLIMGNIKDGRSGNFTGVYKLFQAISDAASNLPTNSNVDLHYNPDATFWMLPCDWAANLVAKIIDDTSRPAICNVVSTQSTLNQEWVAELGRALKVNMHSADKDSLALPATLRSMLLDNMQVKTRNLFEVLGRYNEAPMMFTSEYFEKMCRYAELENWGQSRRTISQEQPFSNDKAQEFFQEFLPANLDEEMLKILAKFGGGIAFQISKEDDCKWLLRNKEGNPEVLELDTAKHRPTVTFHIAPKAFQKLCAGKLMFEQALLLRSLQITGNPFELMKACDFLRKFVKKHPFEEERAV